jgi:predicted DNA-binding transcriptional regulator YafY
VVLPTSARLLRVLTLLQSRRFWSGADLAERLEITERTVRRDIDRLRTLGYPVHATSGVAGGYSLGAGTTLPPLLLEDDEALAVAFGLRSTTAATVTGMAEASLRALTKLEQILPTRIKRRVKAVHQSVATLPLPGSPVDSEVLADLAMACREGEVLRFGYEDLSSRATRRLVEPHGLVHIGARWYLVAWDRSREDWRTFRVDRVRPSVVRAGHFTPRPLPAKDLADYVSRSIAADMYPHRARFIVHAPAKRVAERVSRLAARIEPLDDARCLVEAGGPGLEFLPLYVANIGFDFEVLEPPELVEKIADLVARLERAVRGPRKDSKPGSARGARNTRSKRSC